MLKINKSAIVSDEVISVRGGSFMKRVKLVTAAVVLGAVVATSFNVAAKTEGIDSPMVERYMVSANDFSKSASTHGKVVEDATNLIISDKAFMDNLAQMATVSDKRNPEEQVKDVSNKLFEIYGTEKADRLDHIGFKDAEIDKAEYKKYLESIVYNRVGEAVHKMGDTGRVGHSSFDFTGGSLSDPAQLKDGGYKKFENDTYTSISLDQKIPSGASTHYSKSLKEKLKSLDIDKDSISAFVKETMLEPDSMKNISSLDNHAATIHGAKEAKTALSEALNFNSVNSHQNGLR